MATDASIGPVSALAKSLGAGEPSIRLLLSLFAGYPLAFLYRNVFYGMSPRWQHVYFTTCGLLLCYFNFGGNVIHSLVNICIVWLVLKFSAGTALSVAIAFIFNTAYLVCGYYSVSKDDYDISWATPHCVLTLRLTGVVYDVYDGCKNKESLSSEQKETALSDPPSLLEMMGHTYYFGGFLVGPQFSMRTYLSFVRGILSDHKTEGPPRNVPPALLRLLIGVLYIAVFQVFCGFVFTYEYMLTSQFSDLSFLNKCVYILVWGKLTLSKYVGCWLVAEGSCMLTGLTYNGKDINGNSLWDGCTNVKLWNLESSSTFREMISGFNVNTNAWMSRYIFKRLRFLGNKELSQAVTLLYLSVWHGLHPGYYMNFFLEFIMLAGETQVSSVLRRLPSIERLCNSSTLQPFVWTMKKLLLQFFVSYALVSFVHLKWHRFMQVYSSVNYVGHMVFLVLPPLCALLRMVLPRPVKPVVNGIHKHEPVNIAEKKEN